MEIDPISVMMFMTIWLIAPMILLTVMDISSSIFEAGPIPKTKIEYVYVEKIVQVKDKSTSKQKPVEELSKLQLEAIGCLTSLGMKKKDAQDKVKTMFNKKEYVSIEDFLMDAYKMGD